jgi:hypothetical protein
MIQIKLQDVLLCTINVPTAEQTTNQSQNPTKAAAVCTGFVVTFILLFNCVRIKLKKAKHLLVPELYKCHEAHFSSLHQTVSALLLRVL